jgi:hypothetical protein
MKKTLRLTESDLARIVKRILNENAPIKKDKTEVIKYLKNFLDELANQDLSGEEVCRKVIEKCSDMNS